MESQPQLTSLPAAVAVVQRRLVQWDANGNPIVVTQPLVTKDQIGDLYLAAVGEPYVPDLIADPTEVRFAGMAMVEVMVRKEVERAARTGETEVVVNRIMGKPKQTTEKTSITLTYEDVLKKIARDEALKGGGAPPHAIPTTATPAVDAIDLDGIL